MKQKREEKRLENKSIVEEEINKLKAVGKVGSRVSAQRRSLINQNGVSVGPKNNIIRRDTRASESNSADDQSQNRLEVSSSNRHAIEDIFQVECIR